MTNLCFCAPAKAAQSARTPKRSRGDRGAECVDEHGKKVARSYGISKTQAFMMVLARVFGLGWR